MQDLLPPAAVSDAPASKSIHHRVLSLGTGVQLDLWPNEREGMCGV